MKLARRNRCVLVVSALLLAGCAVWNSDAVSSSVPVGANLEKIQDWSRTNAFADVMKQARGFGPIDRAYDVSVPVPVGADGWPTADFGILFFSGGNAQT